MFEDCRRLAPYTESVEPLFCTLMETERTHAGLGVVTTGRDRLRWLSGMLKHARDDWEQPVPRDPRGRHVAFVLGVLLRRACDRAVKPLMKQCAATAKKTASPPSKAFRDVSAYYDTHIFRHVYLSGASGPFNHFLFADNQTVSGQAVEMFVRALFQRTLLASHSLVPDEADMDGWIDRLVDAVQPIPIDLKLFVDVFERPDPDRFQQYGVDTRFYRADDPAIQAARRLQHGEHLERAFVQQALAKGANTSHYGRALELGIVYLNNASAVWSRKTETLLLPDMPLMLEVDAQYTEHPANIETL
jgi:hypothetical protein